MSGILWLLRRNPLNLDGIGCLRHSILLSLLSLCLCTVFIISPVRSASCLLFLHFVSFFYPGSNDASPQSTFINRDIALICCMPGIPYRCVGNIAAGIVDWYVMSSFVAYSLMKWRTTANKFECTLAADNLMGAPDWTCRLAGCILSENKNRPGWVNRLTFWQDGCSMYLLVGLGRNNDFCQQLWPGRNGRNHSPG